ncbi:hypothetical protein F4801DRAFT_577969 [Xylaria longipes]|nr:hypothetical protein F4801DRAFT_577969 [Xylaria longipes]
MEDADKTEDPRSASPIIEVPDLALPNDPNAKRMHLRETSLRFTNEANAICKRLKRSVDHSSNYWGDVATIHHLRSASKQYTLGWEQEEYIDEGGNVEDFLGLEKTAQIKDAIKAHDRLRDLYCQQQKCLENSSSSSRELMALFTTSRRGLDVNAGMGSRERKDQRAFHKALLHHYNLEDKNDDSKQGWLWSITHGDWVPKETFKAAHIYPYSWGQQRMTELFGEECSDELFSARNGLMLPWCIEQAMGDWAIVIVPAIDDDPTTKRAKEWTESSTREYKFRVLNPNHPALSIMMAIPLRGGTPICGKDLDQVRLQFRGEQRPRARYLWLWFACAVLRCFWERDLRNAPSSLASQLGKGMWGTRGSYMRKDFILGLMEEIGHEGEFLMDGAKPAISTEDDVPNKALVDLVNQQIASRGEEELDVEEYLDNIRDGSDTEE